MFNRNRPKGATSHTSSHYGSNVGSVGSGSSQTERRWTLEAIANAGSSLTAFEVVSEISQKQLSDSICALTVCDNDIYIATKSGQLSIWEAQQVPSSGLSASTRGFRRGMVKMKRSQELRKAKKFRSMVVCREIEILIAVLNDGYYVCVNSKTLAPMNDNLIPNKTRHAEYVIADFKSPYFRFVIGSKKNLYIFEWDKNGNKFSFVRDISVGESAISVVFYNNYLCYSSLKSGYKMHDIKTGQEKDIMVPLQPGVVPRMAKIMFSDDNEMKMSNSDSSRRHRKGGKKEGHLLVQV